MLAPGTAPPGAVGHPTTPHRVFRGVPQPGDTPPARALAQITSGQAGYHLGLAILCLAQTDPAPPAIHGDRALDLGHPHRPHTNRGRYTHAEVPPPPRPQHSLTCGYHAIHRVICRVGLSPELAYPLPTTDQEVHEIRKLVCEILAAVAEDGKLLLQTARPTTDHTSAPLRADTYTDTTPPPPRNPGPCPSPLAAHPETQTRPPSRAPPGPATRASPTRPNYSTRPPRTHPPDTLHHPPHSTTRTHPARGAPRPTARPPRPVARTHPPRTPQKTQAHPPKAPKCSTHELFPPADANPHNLTHCRTPARPSREREDRSPAPPSPTAADQIGPPGRQVTAGAPQPPTLSLQPEDMPSILPAVAAAEAAAHKPATARIRAQPASPKTTTSSSSSASSTSSTSSSDPPLPADLIHKATAKATTAAARQDTGDPPTPTQAKKDVLDECPRYFDEIL